MSIAFVRQIGGSGTTSPIASTATTFTAGNLLVAIVGASYSGVGASLTVVTPAGWTDSGLGTKNDGAPNGGAAAFYMPNNPGGSQSWSWTTTINAGGTLITNGYTILEFSGAATSSPLDLTAVAGATGGTSSTSVDTTAATGTTAAGDLITELAQCYRNTASLTFTQAATSVPSSGWTVGTVYDGAAGVRVHTTASYTIQASGVANPHGILTSSATTSSAAFLLTFKQAATGVTVQVPTIFTFSQAVNRSSTF